MYSMLAEAFFYFLLSAKKTTRKEKNKSCKMNMTHMHTHLKRKKKKAGRVRGDL